MTHADSDDAVVEWTSLHGADGEGSDPDVVVRGDGRVTLSPRFGGGRAVEARIPPERAGALLRAIVEDHAVFDLDADRLAADAAAPPPAVRADDDAVLRLPLGPPYADAGTTRLDVAVGPRRTGLAVHGLAAAAREHPESATLQALRAIELELLALADELTQQAG
jgi:hypothetical protein